jgi:hypothetical protein
MRPRASEMLGALVLFVVLTGLVVVLTYVAIPR